MSRAFALPAAITATVLAVGTGTAPVAFSETTGAPKWRIADLSDRGHYDWMDEVVATGPANAWAFGGTLSTQGQWAPTAARWDGKSWTSAKLPTGLVRPITTAEATGPRNVWAFAGGDAAGKAYAIRWNGRAWRISKRWPGNRILSDAVVLSQRNVWVFGSSRIGPGVGIWHFDGNAWTKVQVPIGTLGQASAVARNDMWAVGTAPTGYDMVAHWNGTDWTQVNVPGLPAEPNHQVFFSDIHAQSANDVWVVGAEYESDEESFSETPLVLHFDGTKWQRVQVPVQGARWLRQATPDGHGGVWFISSTDEPYEAPELLRYRNGRWTTARPQRPDGTAININDLATVPRSSRLWAAGETFPPDRANSDSAIWSTPGN